MYLLGRRLTSRNPKGPKGGGGGSTSAPAATLQAISSVSVTTDGTLIVNGSRFFPISGQKVDYIGWSAAGYTTAQADAKLADLVAHGMNTVMGNWGDTMPDQVANMWTNHNCYWLGSATLAPNQGGKSYLWGDVTGLTSLQTVIAGRNYSNLLSWTVAGELNPQVSWASEDVTITPATTGGTLGTGSYIYTVVPLDGLNNWSFPTSIEKTVSVTGPSGSVALSWVAFGVGTGNYEVWRGTVSGQAITRYTVTGATTFTDTGAAGTAGSAHGNQFAYANVTSVIQAQDALKRPQGDLMIFNPDFDHFLTTSLVQYNRAELQTQGPVSSGFHTPLVILTDGTTGEYTAFGIQQIYNATNDMRQGTPAGCVAGMSLTAMAELNNVYPTVADNVARPYYGTRRCYLLPVAGGCKAIEFLWGPNQRSGSWQNNGDTDLTNHFPALLNSIWPNHMQALSEVSSLSSVIAAQGTFTPIPTTGAGFTFPPLSTTTQSNVFLLQGVYAASKVVGGTTWVIAVNLVQAVSGSTDPSFPNQAVDQTLTYARIDTGQTIHTATRWAKDPTQGPVTFSGGVITDNFTPGEVHVYQVT